MPLPQPGVDDSDPARIDRRIAAERIDAVYAATAVPLLSGVAYAALVAWALWPLAPTHLVAGWTAWLIALTAWRLADIKARARDPQRDTDAMRWARRYVALMVLYAAAYCAAPIIFLAHVGPGLHLLLICGAVGAAAVGVFTTYFHAGIGIAFLAVVLMPLGIDQVIHHGAEGQYLAMGVGIYAAVLVVEVLRGAHRFGQTVRLRHENAAIAEERRVALVLAEHAAAAKSRFLTAVSHELRTPLNGIVGMAELLRGAAEQPQQRQRLDVVLRSAQHLQSVIGDLLDLSRIEFGHLSLDDQSYDPRRAVTDVTDLLGPVAQQRGLGFRVEQDVALPPRVRGDAARLRQVLHNLVGNALKYTRRGEVCIQAGWSGGLLRVRVRDTGPGIPPEQIDRIFDAFARAPVVSAPDAAGTGLGLTLSRQMARAMGGDVVCESTLGMGSTFMVTVAAPPDDASTVPDSDAGAAEPRFQGRALVVEDNAVNALVAVAVLEHLGLQAEVAESGEAALPRLQAQSWSVVLMDIQMPDLDGLATTRRWRLQEAARGGARVPIVALTANAAPGERERCLAAGMDDFLTKPFSQRELAAALARHLPPRLDGMPAAGPG
ncbi:MAG: ATP-binding protein [Aquabacterium sp.]